MRVKYYEKQSVRNKRAWKEAADKMGVHPVILKRAYIDRWCVPIQARDFIELVHRKGDGDKKFIAQLREQLAEIKMTAEEIAAKEIEEQKWAEEMDFTDILNYRLKKLIRVGDEIVSEENKTFLSGGQYQTKGKRYKIISLDDKRENLTGFCAITNADIKDERIWWCVHGVRSLWRNGKEIWNWWTAYHALWLEDNPNHPQNEELRIQSEKGAALSARGEKVP